MAALASRLGVWVVALVAPSLWDRVEFNATVYDLRPATHPFGWGAANSVVSSLAHWDAVWYLLIANKTYVGPNGIPQPIGDGLWDASIGFFPGYPMTVRLLSGLAATPAIVAVVAYVVSLLAFVAALYFLYRLAELELGPKAATWATALFALFPGAVFFATPYAESLFALVCVGCLYAARTGRWRLACLLAAAAAITRLPGVFLVVPLAFFYLDGPSGRERRRAIRADAAWLLLVPAALLAYFAYCWDLTGDVFAYFHIGNLFFRGLTDPVSGAVSGFRAGWRALEVVLFGAARHPDDGGWRYADLSGLLAFAAAAALTVGVFRNLPRAYGWFCAVMLLVILCTGVDDHPLSSAMRYLAVTPPLFLEAGRLVATRPRIAWATATTMAALLAVITSAYARWFFVG